MNAAETKIEFIAQSIIDARKAYEDGKPYITDEVYDELMERLKELQPDHPALNRHLTPVNKGDVEMPFCLPSLAKIRPDNGANDWLEKNTTSAGFVISAKLDGLAAMAIYKRGKLVEMYSSSDDGYTGKDIMHLAPYIENLPKTISDKKTRYAVRLELIVSKKDFATVSDEYKNARNFASGIKNATKGIHKHASLLSAVALSLLEPRYKPSTAFAVLKNLGFEVAKYKKVDAVNSLELSRLLVTLSKYKYNIDGLVIEKDRETKVPTSIPSNVVAFKDNTLLDYAEATVVDVMWEISRYGKYTPVILVEPVELEGTIVQRATAHNAKFVKDNRIGKGAIVHLIKSGSIIPKIEKVLKPSKINPFKQIAGKYMWNETNVDIFIKDNEDNDEATVRRITHFFNVLGVDGLRVGSVRNIYESGKVQDEADMLSLPVSDWVSELGMNGRKIHSSIQAILKEGITIPQLAYASGLFGRGMGYDRLQTIYDYFGHIDGFLKAGELGQSGLETISQSVLGNKTGIMFAENYSKFIEFVEKLKESVDNFRLVEVESIPLQSDRLRNFTVCFTGVRDKELELLVRENGGSIVSSVNKDTTHLVVRDLNSTSSKAVKARDLEIPLLTLQEFKDLINKKLKGSK